MAVKYRYLDHEGIDEVQQCEQGFIQNNESRRSRSPTIVIAIFLIAIISTNLSTFFLTQKWNHRYSLRTQSGSQDVLINLKQSIKYQEVQPSADAWKDQTYSFQPSDESDQAWSELQRSRGIYLSQAEAEQHNLSSSTLKVNMPEPQIAAVLGVQHNIHCLRILRQLLYPSYYYPNKTAEELERMVVHAGHCIESIRTSVMCVPDLTPLGAEWEDEERTNLALNPSARKQCVDWESLVDWELTRSYRLKDLWESNPVLVEDETEDATYRQSHDTKEDQEVHR